MEIPILEKYLLGGAEGGDMVLIEYTSTYPLEEFSWGFLIPRLVKRGEIAIGDFFGVGDLLFRNYIRGAPVKAYSRVLELIKRIKIVKIGPGSASYGEVIDEVVPSYNPQDFLKNYHAIVNRMIHSPTKPEYFVTFGLAHYIRFGGDGAIKALITGISTIPMEDWASVHLINVDVLERAHLAMLEEIASMVFGLSKDGVTVKKGREAFDSGG
ncbi:DUF257 family protein [Thermococcus celer]|uniref:Biotin synthase n=1 Tax=Thermococcus celer Vu 13 = JCM 8558 TaxID=1293037 RepID=A0A218P202_THECE|nr:DUF257 family protein [Thermococcus celer]ASI98940.1 biotin synthase [Thermococcus celer] [Thermococcus celer Vu 13 = JCM 8558]